MTRAALLLAAGVALASTACAPPPEEQAPAEQPDKSSSAPATTPHSQPGTLTLQVSDATAEEAAAAGLRFTVRISEQVRGKPVVARYATEDVTAQAGTDYAAQSGTLKFTGTTTEHAVTVALRDDDDYEGQETLRLRATVIEETDRFEQDEAFGLGTIRDDDEPPDLSRWVEPRIGSYPPGFTNPGPVRPFGMVGLGPDTEGPLNFGGYYFHNALISGFSHVHMSAGVPKGGYIPVLPFTGELTPGDLAEAGWPNPAPAYASAFDHATEVATPGYYAVRLSRYGVVAELTTTERAGLHRYTFADPRQPRQVLIDVSRTLAGYRPAAVALRGDGVLVGHVHKNPDRNQNEHDEDAFPIYFALRARASFVARTFDGGLLAADHATGTRVDQGVILAFEPGTDAILLKVGISYTDADGALRNLGAELLDWDFDLVRERARTAWNAELARILVDGGTAAETTSFYTALYRLLQFPNLHSDIDGRYRGPDKAIHHDTRPHYSQFSSWDSYRGQNQMQAEIVPERYDDMVRSVVTFGEQGGAMPRWQEGPQDSSHMSGDPIVPFVAEAWCRGALDDETRARLWPELQELVANRDPRLAARGYLPVKLEPYQPTPVPPFDEAQKVVKTIEGSDHNAGTTLEYGIADFALALMAQTAAGADAAASAERSLNYRNLLDPETRWIRPRLDDADGSWLTPFFPENGYGFQEGTSWQYSWLAMHDYAGLIERMGGDAKVNARLDTFFAYPLGAAPLVWPTVQNQATVFGLEYRGNQFAPGNEHDLEAPFVYNYTGAPWKSQAVARAAASIYTPTINGLPGNDDLGALSGWLLWTMAGLYPINPGTPLVVVGSPVFEKVTIRRPGGDLVIEAPGASIANKYVQSVAVNGIASEQSWLVLPRSATHIQIELGPAPNMAWGAAASQRPPSLSTHALAEFGCLTAPPAGAEPQVAISADRVHMSSATLERTWTRRPFRTERLADPRTGRVWSENSADFVLVVDGAEIPADRFEVAGEPGVQRLPNGTVRTTLTLAPIGAAALPFGFTVTRVIEMYPGVAGMRQQTWLNSLLPLVVSGYSLDEARPAGAGLTGTIHSFRAGADWRDPEWGGPPLAIGDPHAGDWRASQSGAAVSGTAQWLSVTDGDDRRLFYVMERNDYASSMMSFGAGRARAHVDLSRDIIYLGPLEEDGHVENPESGPGRHRVVTPGTPLRLEPVFTGLGVDGDDEPWQHYKYLANYRMPPYRREITFNSNGVDSNRISTGAKDDMDLAETQRQAAIAAEIGIETFILDDGWQARSGDWCPDSVAGDPTSPCQEPRRDTPLPSSAKVASPRFPDSNFSAVRAVLAPAGMNLGLWWTPMHFHPSARAFAQNPQWACEPVSAALLAVNLAQPDSSSNEAGIVQWNPEAVGPNGRLIDYIEGRIRRAIDTWGVRYFKFDFTAWLDCGGAYPVDIYTYRESFMAMMDRVLADYPDVTLQMDETNDYRLFPFEALARGPTWYQNGSPTTSEALHANHVLTPFLPPYALGRNALRAGDIVNGKSVDYQMAVALLSHMTFFNNLASIPVEARPAVRVWTDYFRARRDDLAQFTYPLLPEDPLDAANWAAFQAWNPETGRGALLAYRQDSAEATKVIRLRNVPDGTYRLYEAPADTPVTDHTAAQLRAGLAIALPEMRSARVLRIERIAN